MPKSHIPRNRKARTTKPKRKLHALEVLADKANQLSLDELQEIFNEYLPVSNVDGVGKDEKRTWTFIDGPSLKSTPELKDQVWTLFEENMRDIYIQANDPDIPWDPVQKHKELEHKKTRLILVRTPNSESLDAFCSFRFEAEQDESGDMRFLVYIYEIQVAHGRRGTGIFRRMLTALEGMCVELGVQVIMLTCFKCNTQALPVYTHLGFKEVDDESETWQEFWKPVSVATLANSPGLMSLSDNGHVSS